MAAKKSEEAKGTNGHELEKPPDGFDVDAGTPDLDGWFKPERGAIVQGQIVGVIDIEDEKNPGRTRRAVLIKLEVPCAHCVVDKVEGVTLEAGKILAVGVRAKLTGLLEYIESRGRCWIQAKDQKAIGKGRKIWEFDVRMGRGSKKGPIPQVAARVPSAPAGAMDQF